MTEMKQYECLLSCDCGEVDAVVGFDSGTIEEAVGMCPICKKQIVVLQQFDRPEAE